MSIVIRNCIGRILGIVILLVFTFSVTASALPDVHKEAIDRNSVHHFRGSGTEDSCGEGSGSVTLRGNSNIAKAFNFLVDEGLTSDQAAGVVGNLQAESGVLPARKQGESTTYKATLADIREAIRLNKANSSQGFGIGIAQWTTWTRLQGLLDFAGNRDPLTLEVQLPYLFKELPANGLPELKQADNLRQATWIFLAFFERPATVVDAGLARNPNQPSSGPAKGTLDERTRLAQAVLNSGGDSASTDTEADSTAVCGGTFGEALNGDESPPNFNKNYDVKYDGPPANNQCSGGFTPGAESLRKIIMAAYSPPVTSIGGYACRDNTADPGSISIHGVGRALDIMVDGTTPAGKATGDRIRNLLINNAEQVGVQLVIWDRHIWSVNHRGWRVYDGPNPHTDHLHVEINIAASENPQLGR